MPDGHILDLVSVLDPQDEARHACELLCNEILSLYEGNASLELCDRIVAELEGR